MNINTFHTFNEVSGEQLLTMERNDKIIFLYDHFYIRLIHHIYSCNSRNAWRSTYGLCKRKVLPDVHVSNDLIETADQRGIIRNNQDLFFKHLLLFAMFLKYNLV